MSRSGFQSPNVQRREDSARTQDQRVSPGKTTLTSGLSSGRGAVQRKPAGSGAAGPARTAWQQTMSSEMDAAHRGAAVQMREDPAAQPGGQAGGQVQLPGRVVTREEVHANPQAYGIPEGGNPDDWFNEYIAHTVAYMQPEQFDRNALDPAAPDYAQRLATIERHRAQMEAWGYNPDSLTFLNDSRSGDTESGLQAVRIDPRDPEGGAGSIVGFRGTEPFAPHQSSLTNPTGALDDVATDLGRDIGSTQYGPNQERIRALIAGGSGPITLTGHSLGGALAQHAAADTTDLGVRNVVGFQAPGIDSSSAEAFNRANADGRIGVRFHEHNNDVVHRAGEQKLGGTHHSYTDTNDPFFGSAHTSYFMYNGVNGDGQQVTNVGAGSTAATSTADPITNRLGWEGGRRLLGGALNTVASPFQGAFALGQGLGNAAVNAGTGLRDAGGAFVGGLADGAVSLGTGIADGASQIADGNVLSGLGTMASGAGRGIASAAGGVWDGATGLVGTAGRAVGDTAGAVWNGVSTAGSHLVDGVGTMAHGVGNLAQWGWNGVSSLWR